MKSESAAKRLIELAGKCHSSDWQFRESPTGSKGPRFLFDGNSDRIVADVTYGRDGEFIAESRTLAPKIAEALLIAIDGLRYRELNVEILRKIEKIFAEGE